MHSARFRGTFLILLKFAQIKEGGMAKFFGLPFCISFLKGLRTRTLCHSLHFNLFFMIHEYFCQIFQISQTKEGMELISLMGTHQFSRTAELFGPPFCISILKILRPRTLRHSLDFNVFCIIQQYFSHTFQIFET